MSKKMEKGRLKNMKINNEEKFIFCFICEEVQSSGGSEKIRSLCFFYLKHIDNVADNQWAFLTEAYLPDFFEKLKQGLPFFET